MQRDSAEGGLCAAGAVCKGYRGSQRLSIDRPLKEAQSSALKTFLDWPRNTAEAVTGVRQERRSGPGCRLLWNQGLRKHGRQGRKARETPSSRPEKTQFAATKGRSP